MSREIGVIHTADPKLQKVLQIADNVASSRATVLIIGESGCGKELLARYLHNRSPRAHRKLVAVNCAAIPETLLESELFGYEKGAFTGADQRRPGKFELADGSTFLLDEISELPLILQAKLLRVLQEGEVERLGGQGPVKINVRLVATSNRDIKEMVARGQFREDLFYRLNVVPLAIPPLRQRPKDIELLARMFLEISTGENGITSKELAPDAVAKLQSWNWPGNVRELQNVIERSVLMCTGESLASSDILIDGFSVEETGQILKPGMTVGDAEKYLILKTLESTGQNRTKAAELLGISIRTLRNKINEYKEAGVL